MRHVRRHFARSAIAGAGLLACTARPTPDTSPAGEDTQTVEPAETGADTETGDSGRDTSDAPPPDPQTVIVIVLDTGRYDLFDETTMPRLYARRGDGLYATVQANVAGWTLPTTVTLMSGVRLEEQGFDPQGHALPDGAYTGLARILYDAGWSTYLNTTNNLVSHNLADGFDVVSEHDTTWSLAEQSAEVLSTLAAADPSMSQLVWLQPMNLHVAYDKLDPICEADAIAADAACPEAVIHATGNDSFTPGEFSTLNKDETEWCRVALESAQRCAATRVDSELDALISALPPDALVVVTTDHGEGWLDPRIEHNWGASAKLTRGFMLLLHPTMAGEVVPLASQADLAPTVLDFVGVERSDLEFEGGPMGEPSTRIPTSWYCDGMGHLEIAAWSESQQLIRVSDPTAGVSWELYDLATDPTGDTNLADTAALPTPLVDAAEAKMSRTAALCPAP